MYGVVWRRYWKMPERGGKRLLNKSNGNQSLTREKKDRKYGLVVGTRARLSKNWWGDGRFPFQCGTGKFGRRGFEKGWTMEIFAIV